MSETSTIIVVAIIAAVFGYALARMRGREGTVGQGRLTVDAQRTTTTITKNLVGDTSKPSDVADALESILASLPQSELAEAQPGKNTSIKTNVTTTFKLPGKEVAEAVAERERAKGMSVVVTPPDATDQNWRVTSTS